MGHAGSPWVLRLPLGAQGRESTEEPLRSACPFLVLLSPLVCSHLQAAEAWSFEARHFQDAWRVRGPESRLCTQALPLPPTWACRYLCVAGFHFNGSNLRMRQCHFYEVGVKKIYSLFQKAFFFFQGKKV